MLKQTIGLVFLGGLVIGQAPVGAIAIQDVPNPRQLNGTWVSDSADLLDEVTEAKLNLMIDALERSNGAEIAVVTVPETAPAQSPKQFATSLFNTWKIGKRDQNNGVLFLISKGDRRIEIETGTGLAQRLPNSKVAALIEGTISPAFKQGQFQEGTIAGTESLIRSLETLPRNSVNPPSSPPPLLDFPSSIPPSLNSPMPAQSSVPSPSTNPMQGVVATLVLLLGSILVCIGSVERRPRQPARSTRYEESDEGADKSPIPLYPTYRFNPGVAGAWVASRGSSSSASSSGGSSSASSSGSTGGCSGGSSGFGGGGSSGGGAGGGY